MSTGKAIPVWFSAEDHRRVEEAAVLAGYKHLSRYIRDRSLGRVDNRQMQPLANQQALVERLAEIEHSQKTSHALLAMLLFLARKKATSGEFNALALACENAGVPADLLAATLPELATLLARFTEAPSRPKSTPSS